jgi:capsular exopolysaccharide synthesis family protein
VWVIASLGAALVVAGVLTWTATPQYSSTTRLFISTSQSDESSAYTGNLFATQRVTSYADLVASRRVAESVADRLGDDTDPRDLREQVEATVVPETVILEISATDADPERAADLAQAYAEELSLLVDELETPKGKQDAVIKATLVDDGHIAEDPVSPQPLRNLALAGVLGLLLGVGLAVARELLDTSVKGADDVAGITDAPVLGTIFVDNDAKRPPADVLATATPWAEAFRVLRTSMQYIEVDHDQKVVVVTSSLPEEGKSTTAVNLALTLTQAGHRVALVECDLRRPLIAERLSLDNAIGTTTVLIGKVSVEDAIQTYGNTDLDVLACGPIPPNPSELLQSNAMEKMLTDLRSRYDTIILDAPPLLPVTDAALLATRADGAVVVVRHGKTTRDQLAHALERLEAVDSKALGLVMNMTPAKQSQSAYGYGYGYGYAPLDEEPAAPVKGRRRRA